MESNQDYMEIDLRDIFRIIKKRIWIILVVTLLSSITAAIISYFYITPIYESSTQLLVNKSERNPENIYNLSDINTDLKLVDTYSVIIKSPRIMELVVQDLDLNMNAGQLTQKVRVSPVKNSQVISITVQDPDPQMAATIANGVAQVFKKEIVNIMNVDNVQILNTANVGENPAPVKPKPGLNIMIAFVVGIMLSLGIIFLLEFLDNTLHTEQDVECVLNLPVLGSIPKIEETKTAHAGSTYPNTQVSAELAAGSDINEKK
ncbi:MAG: capsular biosynthesis protein [Bacillaceae bacterium]|nr:capsular biosynthesis protein [Bacillaceae bacterium]